MHPAALALTPLIRPGGIVLIGEWHGTNEFPQLIAEVVSQAAAQDLPTIVGLEIPCSEQAAIDGLVTPDTADTADSKANRLDGPWWRQSSEFRDGRSSQAMANLVASLAGKATVTIVAMDGPWVAPGSEVPLDLLHLVESPRDETMARHLLDAMDASPRAFTVVLGGSEHTKVGIDDNGRPTLGRYITQWHPSARCLLGRSSGGEAWGLRKTMGGGQGPYTSGPFAVPDDADVAPGAQWTDRPGSDGHHGYVHVGPVTASPPTED